MTKKRIPTTHEENVKLLWKDEHNILKAARETLEEREKEGKRRQTPWLYTKLCNIS